MANMACVHELSTVAGTRWSYKIWNWTASEKRKYGKQIKIWAATLNEGMG
jgi:hypothetical protein